MSKIEVNEIVPQSGTTLTLGGSGDTIAITSGASLTGFTSTGIDDNASSTAVTILSSGYVGVGQTNPTTNFHVGDDSAGNENTSIRIEGGSTSGYSQVHFADSGDVNVGRIQYTHSSNTMALYTNDAEAMRIDSSGNVLVGKTSVSVNNDGIQLEATGTLGVTRDGNDVLIMNRKTSDGDIAVFRKDGTTEGSIGISFSRPYFANDTIGIKLGSTFDLRPTNSSGTNNDNAIDLGVSSVRFRHLYLGGSVYLGGTGSANALDDYEEGTWTPSATFGTTNPTAGASTGVGEYVKIGDMVTVWGGFTNINVTGASGDSLISGFPFTSKLNVNLTAYKGVLNAGVVSFGTSNSLLVDIADGQSFGRVLQNRDNNSINIVQASQLTDGQTDYFFTISYKV